MNQAELKSRTQLKKSLKELRDSINLEKRNWENITTSNCYAYALGLDIDESEVCKYVYVPGVIGGSTTCCIRYFDYDNLIKNLYLDFKALHLSAREIDIMDHINEDEWKIAMFLSRPYGCIGPVEDYHFLRYDPKENVWYHKRGYGNVSKYDHKNKVIYNPLENDFGFKTYDRCFCLKKRKNT